MGENVDVYSKEFVVNSHDVGVDKKLTLPGMLQFLQETASVHADLSGFGHKEMLETKLFWVLTQLKMIMKKWPLWNQKVEITTWSRAPKDFQAIRDFEIRVNGEVIGEVSSLWMVLDGRTRKPVKIKNLPTTIEILEERQLSFLPKRVLFDQTPEKEKMICVRNSDLDMNRHVNNVKYSQWILDTLPLEELLKLQINEYEINFISEAYCEDEVLIKRFRKGNELFFMGIKEGSSRPIFTSKLVLLGH